MATGVNVSKGNLYGAVSPPTGDGVSKANLYAVLAPPIGVNVSKANLYAVLVARGHPASDDASVWLEV
jgi:hypothetical protein